MVDIIRSRHRSQIQGMTMPNEVQDPAAQKTIRELQEIVEVLRAQIDVLTAPRQDGIGGRTEEIPPDLVVEGAARAPTTEEEEVSGVVRGDSATVLRGGGESDGGSGEALARASHAHGIKTIQDEGDNPGQLVYDSTDDLTVLSGEDRISLIFLS